MLKIRHSNTGRMEMSNRWLGMQMWKLGVNLKQGSRCGISELKAKALIR